MSNSEKEFQGEVHVVSQTGPIRIELFDHQFKRLALGFGELRHRVTRGLYTLRYTAGTAQREEHLSVDPDDPLSTIYVDLPFPAAAPIGGSSTSHEFHRSAAMRLSRKPNMQLGIGGCLMFFARTIDGDGRSSASLEGLSLLNAKMTRILDLEDRAEQNPEEGWIGQCLELDPGGYLLRWPLLEDEGESGESGPVQHINQSLWVARGWITIVFLPYHAQNRRLGRQSASIYLVEIGKPFRADDLASTQAMEIVLSGLRTGNLVVPANLLNLLLDREFQNPMLGIVGAHALLQRSDRDWDLFDNVLDNLEKLIPGHPDLIALRLMEKLMRPDAKEVPLHPLDWPPMFYAGYRALVACDWTSDWLAQDLVEDGSVAEDVASSLLPESPWTCWLAQEPPVTQKLVLESEVSSPRKAARKASGRPPIAVLTGIARSALQRIAEGSPSPVSIDSSRPLTLSDPAVRRVRRYITDLQQMGGLMDLEKLSLGDFRQIGLPVATVRKAIRTLLDAEEDDETWRDSHSRRNQSGETTSYHAVWYAYELTRRNASDDLAKLGATLSGATVDLNPHQLDAALFAFQSPLSRGAILADEVGLGKTIEAGIVMSQLWAERKRRILVITPTTLRKQWAQELADKFFLTSQVLDTAEYNKLCRNGVTAPLHQPEGIIICSYNFAAARANEIRSMPWSLVVIDEAHRLRNVYKAGNKIAAAIKRGVFGNRTLLLTATPLQNNLLELYGLVSLIDEHVFGDVKSFRARYQTVSELGELRERLKPLCQRTLRRQVTEYIRFTNRLAETVDFTPTGEEQELYDKVSEYLRRESLHALPQAQRKLMTMVLRRLLASSTFAIAGTLSAMAERLESQAAAEIIAEDFEALREMAEEWAENDDENDQEAVESGPEIDPELRAEIDELKSYSALAASIINNAKAQALLGALERGFEKLHEIKAKRRAVIFTESRRTQDFLRQRLEANGYAGRVLTINGTNADDRSGAIYRAWVERHEDEPMVTGNKAVDVRAAIVEYFRDHAEILIATEAAAEGVNLQFCSLVVNYDLPWNPQRIEQRIGRCHRYGQQHDVVVFNFLNRSNAADQRVFELLSEKFKLFDGIFGSSDEVLGALGSGVDFERRIADIYQSCREPHEIQAAFDALQRELDEQIQARMADTQRKLFEHFDDEVQQKLRLETRLEDGQKYRSKFERLLWRLTKQELSAQFGRRIVFDDDRFRFNLTPEMAAEIQEPAQVSPAQVSPGNYQLLKGGEQESGYHVYRYGDALAIALIERARVRQLPPAEIVFDYTAYREQNIWHKPKIGMIEDLIGQSGWLSVTMLRVTSLGEEEHLLHAMVNDAGEFLAPEIAERLFQVDGYIEAPMNVQAADQQRLTMRYETLRQSALEKIGRRNNEFFTAEMEKLDRWEGDKRLTLETEIKELDAELSATKKEARRAGDLQAKLELQRRVSDLEAERKRKRRDLYDEQDKIEKVKDELLAATEARLQATVTPVDVFTIRWRVV